MSKTGWAAVVVMLGVGPCLVGCGSGSSTKAASPSTVAINPAADRTTAQAISLTAADLPGWQESPNPPDATNESLGAQLSACAGGPNDTAIDVVDVTSPNFDQGAVEISSDVQTVRSHADALADLRALESPKLAGCIDQIGRPMLAKQLPAGTTISQLSVSTFKPEERLPDSLGLRLGLTVSEKQAGLAVTVSASITEIGFVMGRTELSLNETEKGHPSPIPIEAQLVHTLYARAQAHPTT
jgi:hypothetical protein